MKQLWIVLTLCTRISVCTLASLSAAGIDRHALVTRHNITLTAPLPNSVLQVGNGELAFGVDVTGLQTTKGNAPGFPGDGSWVVKWEGLKKAP